MDLYPVCDSFHQVKAIFYNIFGLGHINPTLPLVKVLCDQGVQIFYHSSPDRKELIQSTGAHFINYGYDEYKAADFNPGKNFVLQTIPATVGLLPFLQEEIERIKPDFILYDSMAPWGYVLGEIYRIPSFCTVSTFALSLDKKQEMLKQHHVEIDHTNQMAISHLRNKFNILLKLEDALGAYGKHNIVFTSKEFNPEIDVENDKHFHFAGSMLDSIELQDWFPFSIFEKDQKKVITMAMGTILPKENPHVINLFKKLIEAFLEDTNFQLILSVGSEENVQSLGKVPSHIHLFPKIPQKEVLKLTDIFINHGGMNSVNEALALGVPIITIPHAHDQFVNAQRLVDLNLGHQLKKHDLTAELIRDAITKVSSDKLLAKNLLLMKNHFSKLNGLEGIVNYIRDKSDVRS